MVHETVQEAQIVAALKDVADVEKVVACELVVRWRNAKGRGTCVRGELGEWVEGEGDGDGFALVLKGSGYQRC